MSLTSAQIAALVSGRLIGTPEAVITSIEALDRAGSGQLTFIRTAKFLPRWPTSSASIALIARNLPVPDFDHSARAAVVVDDADFALNLVLERLRPAPSPVEPGVHPSAVVHPGASVDATASIGPLCTVGPGAVIGPRARLHAGARMGEGARLGADSVLHPGVALLDRCTVGARCTVHANTVIGADGFGYLPAPGGRGLVKVPHIGTVEVHDDVEIGANTCIDRAKFGATLIGQGTKIDNLVQIAHNCRIGRSCVICGCVGIAGSVTLGDGVIIGGGAGIADGITISSGAKIGAQAGVMHDVPEGEVFVGSPAMRHREWAKSQIAIKRLAESGNR
jgi:UDP-3-O-[3-hydroxymyristoyl] glucosamine N-acyltransferase